MAQTGSPEKALQVAKGYIGIHETNGNNRTKIGEEYGWNGVAWCAEATSVWYKKAGLTPNVDFPWTASVAVCRDWYRSHGRNVSLSKLKPGDQVMAHISHTGIVEKVSGSTVTTIEGNTSPGNGGSQRDGGGCYRRVRPKSFWKEAGRPNWHTTSTTKDSGGILGMTKYMNKVIKATTKLAYGKWKQVKLNEKGDLSLFTADGEMYDLTAYLTVSGLKPGETIQVRGRTASYKKGTTTKLTGKYPIVEFVGTTGNTFIDYPLKGKEKKGTGGRSNRIRLQAWTNSKTAKITGGHVKGMKG